MAKITGAYMEQFFRRDFNLHKDSATFLLCIDCEMTDMVCFCHKKAAIEKENRRAYPIAEEAVILKEPRLHSGIPRHVLESIARCLLPDIQAFYESEEGQREFAEWKKKQQEQKENGPDEAR